MKGQADGYRQICGKCGGRPFEPNTGVRRVIKRDKFEAKQFSYGGGLAFALR